MVRYPEIWIDNGGTVDVPESEHLSIPLIPNWESKRKFYVKVYPLSPKGRALVDKEFDRLHQQGRMEWTKRATPFASPVFVVRQITFVGPENPSSQVPCRSRHKGLEPDLSHGFVRTTPSI